MFYSPKKDIERYVSLKNHEIKALKDQIQNEKITEQSLEVARKKLEKVKLQYNILLGQNNHQLIDTLKKSQNSQKLLMQELQILTKQLDLKTNEKVDLLDMRREVLSKVEKAKESLASKKAKKIQLSTQRQSLDETIKKMVDQNEKVRKENGETQSLLMEAKKQLNQRQSKVAKQQQKVQDLKQAMAQVGTQVLEKKQAIGCLKAQQKMQQLKMENLEMKIQYLMQVKSRLLEQKEKMNLNKTFMKERSELNKHQSMSSEIVNCLVKVAGAMKDNKMVEKEACEREIKDKLIELELTECTHNELIEQVNSMKEKITKVEQTTHEITSKLKNLQVQDPELVSILMRQSIQSKDKKIDEKKAVLKSRENKQNVPMTEMKLNQSAWSKMNLSQASNTRQDQSQINCQ